MKKLMKIKRADTPVLFAPISVLTPKHASWMNQVEIWLSILVRKLLKRGKFTSLDDSF